jgi:hypothetical protein
MAQQHYTFYGVPNTQTTFYFALTAPNGTSADRFYTGTGGVFATGDSKISQNGAALANTTNLIVQTQASSPNYSITLTSTEMTFTAAGRIMVFLIDADGPLWQDTVLQIFPITEFFGAARIGLAQAGATTTVTLDSAASAVNGYYQEASILLTGGTGAGQSRTITNYVGSTKVATVNRAWATNPANGTQFRIQQGGDVWDQLDGALVTGPITGPNVSFRQNIQLLRRRFYNQVTQTASVQTVYQDDNATPLTSMTVSDNGVQQVKGVSS